MFKGCLWKASPPGQCLSNIFLAESRIYHFTSKSQKMGRATLQHYPIIQSRLSVVRGSILRPSMPSRCLDSVLWWPEMLHSQIRSDPPLVWEMQRENLKRTNVSLSLLNLGILKVFTTKLVKLLLPHWWVYPFTDREFITGIPLNSGTCPRVPLLVAAWSLWPIVDTAALRMSQNHLVCLGNWGASGDQRQREWVQRSNYFL